MTNWNDKDKIYKQGFKAGQEHSVPSPETKRFMAKNNGLTKNEVSLKEFICTKISDLEEKIELNLKLNQIAIDKAEDKLDLRLASMNEFREALKDQASRFISRVEHDTLCDKVAEIKDILNRRPTWLVTAMFFIASFIIGILVTHFLQ